VNSKQFYYSPLAVLFTVGGTIHRLAGKFTVGGTRDRFAVFKITTVILKQTKKFFFLEMERSKAEKKISRFY
jgi:hypothetical protein